MKTLFFFLALCTTLNASLWNASQAQQQLVPASNKVYQDDFTFSLWIKLNGESTHYPVLASNKDWSSGKYTDMTKSNNFGTTLNSGINKGWAIVTQPNGAWAWNLGTGKSRLDYQPTAQRQSIADGNWHLLSFCYIKERNEVRLFFNGKNVAIYSLSSAPSFHSELPTHLFQDGKGKQTQLLGLKLHEIEATITDRALSDKEVEQLYLAKHPNKSPSPLPAVSKLKVMAWNIWHGGRHNGVVTGVQQTVDIIKDSGADIICMQETYGSGPIIADRLGYYFHLRSTNISILSRYPLGKTYDLFQGFRLGGVEVFPSENQKLNIFSLWIHYLPAWRSDSAKPNADATQLVKNEWKTRAKEIQIILKEIQPLSEKADQVPVIIAGDFNSPSKLDWIDDTAIWHNNLSVDWPVSAQMLEAGYTDTFRHLHSNPSKTSNNRHWIGGAEKLTWRIDYIYSKGKNIKALHSEMWNQWNKIWPSDHPLVLTEFSLSPKH